MVTPDIPIKNVQTANPDDSVLMQTKPELKPAGAKMVIPAAARLIWVAAVRDVLYGETFYVSKLRDLLHLVARETSNVYELNTLALLHCKDYTAMEPEVRTQVRKLCLKQLGIPMAVLGDIELSSTAPNHELVGRLLTFLEA